MHHLKAMSRALLLAAAIALAPLSALAQAGDVCTRAPSTDGTKIVGGTAARAADWPGITSLQVEFPSGNAFHVCGATAISSRWLLTAAHCAETTQMTGGKAVYSDWNADYTALKPRGVLRAVIGVSDLATAQPENIYAISDVVLHPDYIDGRAEFGNDIALLKLARPYTGRTIGLSLSATTDALTLMGELAEVAGYGDLSYGQSLAQYDRATLADGTRIRAASTELMETSLATTPVSLCIRKIEKAMALLPDFARPFDVTAAQLCAGQPKGGADSCQGDSGGPLVKINTRGCPYQVGVVSWGIQCAVEDAPSVYTRVSQYAEWISKTTGVQSGQKQATLPPEQTGALDLFKQIESQFPGSFARIQVELLNTAGKPVTVIEPGQFINLKLTLPIRGKLIILDYNADRELRQLFPNADEGARLSGWPVLEAGKTVRVPADLFRFRFKAEAPYGRQSVLVIAVPETNALPVDVPEDVTEAIASPLTYILSLMRATLIESGARGLPREATGSDTTAAPEPAATISEAPRFALGFAEYCIDSRICGETN